MKSTNAQKKYDVSIGRIVLIWAVSLSVCYAVVELVGYLVTPNVPKILSYIGLPLGGALSGLGTSLELQKEYPKIGKTFISVTSLGWAMAFLVIDLLQRGLSKIVDELLY